ncbi:MAG TPA: O-antigen ligase domain-containing protein [Gammaproteobacteria bacterium]|nr:O-antigen ligase domain-containing protein [Gammaproteobacteria bacterium]
MLHTLLFIAVYLIGFILTFVSNSAFSFILYEAVYFFNPLDRWWSYNIPNIGYSFYTVILMFYAVFIKLRNEPLQNKLLAAPQFKWVYLLLLSYCIAWFYAVLPNEHLEATINFIKLVIIISIAYKLIDNSKNLDYALWGYIFGSWYISFLAWQTGRNSAARVEGIGTVDSPDSNGIAAAIAPSLVICLYYLWRSKNRFAKLLFVFAGVFIANALILINSRGSFLATGTSIIYFVLFMYFSSFQQKYQKITAVWITILGLSAMLYLADENFIERIKTMQNTEIVAEQETGSTRVIFWESAWEMAKDYPFGSGLKGFDYYAPDYIPQDVDTGYSRNRSVHSTWFEALTEIGYLGLLLLILMIYTSFKTLRKCFTTLKEKGDFENYYKVLAIKAALLSFLIAMSFMNRLRAEILYWFILYTACAYNIYVLKPSKGDETVNKDNF